jgi:hypothetical protein
MRSMSYSNNNDAPNRGEVADTVMENVGLHAYAIAFNVDPSPTVM